MADLAVVINNNQNILLKITNHKFNCLTNRLQFGAMRTNNLKLQKKRLMLVFMGLKLNKLKDNFMVFIITLAEAVYFLCTDDDQLIHA